MQLTFKKEFEKIFEQLLNNAFFEDRKFQQKLTDCFYRCKEILKSIQHFDSTLTEGTAVPNPTLVLMLKSYRNKGTSLEELLDFINKIEERAAGLTEKTARQLSLFLHYLEMIMADFKESSPQYISNIRSLGGTRNRELQQLLEQHTARLSLLTDILSHYAVIKEALSA